MMEFFILLLSFTLFVVSLITLFTDKGPYLKFFKTLSAIGLVLSSVIIYSILKITVFL